MQVNITARHFKAHDSIREYAESEIEKLTKYYEHLIKAEVILSFEKAVNSVKSAEIVISSNNHHVFTAKESSDDYIVSIEKAIHKLAAQIRKYKEKITSHH